MTKFTPEFHTVIARETLIVRQNNRHGQVLFTIPIKHLCQDYNLSVAGSALVLNTLPHSRKVLYTAASPESAQNLMNAVAGSLTKPRCGVGSAHTGMVLLTALTLALGVALLKTPYHQAMPAPVTPHTAPLHQPGHTTSLSADEQLQMRARELSRAAADGHYTVALSSGHARTLFVFADPNCPNCKIFEPALQGLSRAFNVNIFPVTLVGHDTTVHQVAPVLCLPPAERAARWSALFDTSAGVMEMGKTPAVSATGPCQAGIDAIARNDMGFSKYQLPGTPIVIADDGRLIPFDALTSDAALTAFLNTPAQ